MFIILGTVSLKVLIKLLTTDLMVIKLLNMSLYSYLEKTANQNTVSNKYFVLIGQFWSNYSVQKSYSKVYMTVRSGLWELFVTVVCRAGSSEWWSIGKTFLSFVSWMEGSWVSVFVFIYIWLVKILLYLICWGTARKLSTTF